MARKTVYFSNYIDEKRITKNPINTEDEGGFYRYSITIPFINATQRSKKKQL